MATLKFFFKGTPKAYTTSLRTTLSCQGSFVQSFVLIFVGYPTLGGGILLGPGATTCLRHVRENHCRAYSLQVRVVESDHHVERYSVSFSVTVLILADLICRPSWSTTRWSLLSLPSWLLSLAQSSTRDDNYHVFVLGSLTFDTRPLTSAS